MTIGEMVYFSHEQEIADTINHILQGCNTVEQTYLLAGKQVGQALSFAAYGEAVGWKRMLKRLAAAERDYANLGYRPVSIDDFVQLGGWGKTIKDSFHQQRKEDEEPVLHAQKLYDEEYPKKLLFLRRLFK